MMKFLINFMNYFMHMMLFIIIFFLIYNTTNHPISIMIILLIYSSLICLNMSMWKMNYILSIFLFLMMISGLLIIFLYFSSLISNEQFKLKINYLIITFFFINLIISFHLMKSIPMNLFINKYKFCETHSMNQIMKMNFNNILNLYEYPTNNLTILSMFYLLFSLFSIIKICSSKSISLRKIN